VDTSRGRNDQPEVPEPRLLREVASAVKRLDPKTPDTLQGGIRFRIDGQQIPKSLAVFLNASLWEEPKSKTGSFGSTGAPPDGESVPLMPGTFPIQTDGTAWIGVADGKYRLRVWSTGWGGGGTIGGGAGKDPNEVPYHRMVLDFEDVTRDVIDIRGQTVEIPIKSRVLKDIAVQAPADGEKLDLSTAVFRWTELPGAKSYRIYIRYEEKIPGGIRGSEAWSAKMETASYALADVPRANLARLAPLRPGVTGKWHVSASDAKGRLIGASENRTFIVSRELATSP
jgi:hypothetical protein